ncbi:MAG TPA: GGDEF domain-containing protein, partial [Rhodocyclaceae bacterium]|nr:GGDEF domain-containing protein [Rhodocyclaceae bacterium]
PLDQAAEVIRRLQRALTRELFFYGESHRVITFSAGVTPVLPGEALETALARADAAMYEAKRSGKNRVVVKNP